VKGCLRNAAAELGVHRIRVNAVLPGVIETAMTRGMLDQPGVRDGLLAHTPMGRLGTAEDVTAAIRYLVAVQAPVRRSVDPQSSTAAGANLAASTCKCGERGGCWGRKRASA